MNDGLQSSPVDFTVGEGAAYQNSGLQGYDIISWDLRGSELGYSSPSIQCFATEADRDAYAVLNRYGPGVQYGYFNGTYTNVQNIQSNIAQNEAVYKSFSNGCIKYWAKWLP